MKFSKHKHWMEINHAMGWFEGIGWLHFCTTIMPLHATPL